MSNIRWGDEWKKISPREWHMTMYRTDVYGGDSLIICLTGYRDWKLFLNRNLIATFDSWEEAADAAPMLYQLHKD
jgi:hypothetical protein